MPEFDHVEDSGTRLETSTGATRDTQVGKGRYDLVLALPHMIYRLARHFENGAVKYGDDNWRKGLPLRRFIDSAFRHLCQYAEGKENEDHLTAAIWNLMCHGETANEIKAGRLDPELDDMPRYAQSDNSESKLKGIKREQMADLHKTVMDGMPRYIHDDSCGSAEDGPACRFCEADRLWSNCDPKPGDRRINLETGQPETYVRWGTKVKPDHPDCADCTDYYRDLAEDFAFVCTGEPETCTKGTLNPSIPKPEPKSEAPTFYIAGPMRGIPQLNFPLFDAIARVAREQGLEVISPAELDRANGIDPVTDPDSVLRVQATDPNLNQTIARRDCTAILNLQKDRGDGLILLPGWEKSIGARAEVALALWMELKFREVLDESDVEILEMSSDLILEDLFYQSF